MYKQFDYFKNKKDFKDLRMILERRKYHSDFFLTYDIWYISFLFYLHNCHQI